MNNPELNHDLFTPWLEQWQLTIEGEAFASRNGYLLPVSQGGQPAMLKVSQEPEEQAGAQLMAWWAGEGAAPVLAHDHEALLLQRAQGRATLAGMVADGADDQATHILCRVIGRLHKPSPKPLPALVPLQQRFESLWGAAAAHGGILQLCAASARELLASPRDVGVLHGDVHHGNVLDFGAAGWLAIDPKGLYGERGFDYAYIFCNPDHHSALAPGRFARRLEIVAAASGIERSRLLRWVLAWAGLSASWMLEDHEDPGGVMQVAKLAGSALGLIE